MLASRSKTIDEATSPSNYKHLLQNQYNLNLKLALNGAQDPNTCAAAISSTALHLKR